MLVPPTIKPPNNKSNKQLQTDENKAERALECNDGLGAAQWRTKSKDSFIEKHKNYHTWITLSPSPT